MRLLEIHKTHFILLVSFVVSAKRENGKPWFFSRRKVESLSTKVERLQWRRNKVLELSSQGRSQPEIATILQVGLGTVSRDIQYLREQARDNLKTHINQRLPEEYQKCMTGLNQLLKMGWDIVHSDSSTATNRLTALSQINDSYKHLMDLTTNGVVITDAIRFVQTKQGENNVE